MKRGGSGKEREATKLTMTKGEKGEEGDGKEREGK